MLLHKTLCVPMQELLQAPAKVWAVWVTGAHNCRFLDGATQPSQGLAPFYSLLSMVSLLQLMVLSDF